MRHVPAFVRVAEEHGLRGGFDVYTNEPAETDSEFPDAIAENPRVYGAHHIGDSTDQASEAVGDEVAVADAVGVASTTQLKDSPMGNALTNRYEPVVPLFRDVTPRTYDPGVSVGRSWPWRPQKSPLKAPRVRHG